MPATRSRAGKLHYPDGKTETLLRTEREGRDWDARYQMVAVEAGQLLFVLWAVATILFLIFRLMPGNPLTAFIDPTFTEEQQESLLPPVRPGPAALEQYCIYLCATWCSSNSAKASSTRRRSAKLVLAGVSQHADFDRCRAIVAYAVGILLGALLAWKRGTWIEAVGIPAVLTPARRPNSGWGWCCSPYSRSRSAGSRPEARSAPGAEFDGHVRPRPHASISLAHLFLPP